MEKSAVTSLSEIAEKYQALVESTGTGYVVLDLEGKVLDANAEYVHLTGRKDLSAIRGRSVEEWTSEHDRRRNTLAMASCVRDGLIRGLEIDYVDETGRRTPIEINASVVEIGGAHRILSICRDITKRKEQERSMRLLQFAVERAGDAVIFSDQDARIRYANPAACLHLGYSPEEILTLKIQDIDPDYSPEQRRIVRDELKRSGTAHFEARHRRRDGSLVPVDVTIDHLEFEGERFNVSFTRDISERKKAEQELAFSEQKFSAAFTSIPLPTAISDLENGRMIDVNEAFVAWTGFSREETIGRTTKELDFWPEPRQRDRIVDEAERHGFFKGLPARLRRKRGDIRDVLFSGSLFSVEGRRYMVNALQDVSELTQAQKELVSSQRHFAAAFNSSPDPITITDAASGLIIDVNRAFEDFLGFSREEVIGRRPQDLGSWVDPDQRRHLLETIKAAGHIEGFPAQVRTKGGSLRHILCSGSLIEVEGKRYVLNQARDVTESLRLQNERQLSISLLQATLESTTDGILVVDAGGRVAGWNGRFLELWRVPEELAASRDDERMLQSVLGQLADPDGFLAKVRGLYAQPEAESFDTLEFKDGRVFERYSRPQRLEGRVVGRVWSFRDVTEQKRIEAERAGLLDSERKARTEAEAANKAKDDFLAIVSHELRTPLTGILGWTWLLKNGQLGEEERSSALQTILGDLQVQRQIVEDLIDISSLSRGQISLVRRAVDLGDVLNAACDSMHPLACGRGIRLIRELDGPMAVRADARRLQQVFWNLLHNALKFTPDGGEIRVLQRREGSQAIVEVRDSGQGIPAEFLPHVFEPFRQGEDPLTRQHRGLGLGLAIVKRLVELHHGTVDAASAGPGLGAVFTVRLPTLAQPPQEPSTPSEPAIDPRSLKGLRVLIVDDDEGARRLFERILSRCGARTSGFAKTAEAFARMKEDPPDVLLCDIALPEEDGCAFIRRLRARGGALAQVPAVALSGLAREEDRLRALEAGFQAYLAKPLQPVDLIEALRKLASR